MGKFNLDDLLDDLGDENLDAPKEASADASNADAATTDAAPAEAFVRPDPEEVPRPPDFSGAGLGEEVDVTAAARAADPVRLRPTDSLSDIVPAGNEIVPFQEAGPAGTTGFRPAGPNDDLYTVLAERGIIDAEQLESAQRLLKQSPGANPVDTLTGIGVPEPGVQKVVAEIAGLPFERIDVEQPDSIDHKYFDRLGPEFCEQNGLMPLRREGKRLVVGTARADDVFILDDVKRRSGVAGVKHVLVPGIDIAAIIEQKTHVDVEDDDITDLIDDVDEDDVEVVEQKEDDASVDDAEANPVVRLVNHIIQTAVREGASDIHIEPEEKETRVRYRIDGVLFEVMKFPKRKHASITSRLKIMSNLDIAERRLPQDGRIRVNINGRQLDLRVSTVPTPKGEKTVMRILDNRAISVTLDQLGFAEDTLTIWKNQISQPHGIILVTGPTGSGKTTTLYASLQQLDMKKLNISTVEDPVEYNLNGITQIQTHQKIGMTFAKALKALLRQDPDVVMVGEIRDLETATTATQAAMTGHLVLSTLHTNDAPSSITRLINMGIEPFLAAAAVNAVLAQRLVRRICNNCKSMHEPNDEIRDFMTMHGVMNEKLAAGSGCSKCRQTGYSGRQGLYEQLVLDDHLRDAVAGSPNVTEFRRMCSERGMVSLREDGFGKVAQGITTVEEILRVTEATI